jgi:NAD(P)H-dependent FMN reductase
MSASAPTLQIIIASTRPNRVGVPVAKWFEQVAVAHGGFEVELVDLAEVGLPLLDEPHHPRLQRYEHAHTLAWSETVQRADAFALVMPEYNHSFNATLKNALDYLHVEWQHKPVGFVSYGGVAAGTRAVQAIKPVVVALKMPALVEAVSIPFVTNFIGDDGVLAPNEMLSSSAGILLDELVRAEQAWRAVRRG